jgi:hypothetical protein
MLTPGNRKILVLSSPKIEEGTPSRDPGEDEVVDATLGVRVMLVL